MCYPWIPKSFATNVRSKRHYHVDLRVRANLNICSVRLVMPAQKCAVMVVLEVRLVLASPRGQLGLDRPLAFPQRNPVLAAQHMETVSEVVRVAVVQLVGVVERAAVH